VGLLGYEIAIWGGGLTYKVYEQSYESEMGWVACGNQVTESSGKQSPAHLRECEEKQCTATEGVDSPDGRPGEHKIDETETHRCEEGLLDASAGLLEDCTGIECDNVDWILLVSYFATCARYHLLPQSCWASMTVPDATVALRSRGTVKS
jgi:hypothetical protein